MKKILQKTLLCITAVLAVSVSVYAQVPQGFNFQAVARGANGDILADQSLGVQVSVIKGTEDGTAVYQETHSVTTNPLGLFQLIIGEGTPAEGQSFGAVEFGNDNYFVKLAIDVSGGTSYEDLGTTRLLSVPYALVAQKAVESGGSGVAITEYNLNTSEGDTSFIVKATGNKAITGALQVRSETDGQNRGVDSRIASSSGNEDSQLSLYGRAEGEGSGSHFGVYGLALSSGGGTNYGTYGYALGTGKFNFGVQGIAQGEGSGEIVAIGEEVDNNNGSFNIAGGFYAQGNLNGNIGVEGIADGSKGARKNIGVEGGARTGANSLNVGVSGYALNSQLQNVAFIGRAESNSARNVGMQLFVNNAPNNANVGMEVNADTAAILNGDVIINGTLTHKGSGSVGGAATKYDFDTANPDSSFLINVTGTNSGSGIISTASTDGVNAGIEGKALSGVGNSSQQVGTYGEAGGKGTGTHIGVFGTAVNPDGEGTVGRRYGLYGQAKSVGRENIGGFGIGLGAGDGDVVAIGDENSGGSFNIGGFNIGLNGFARQNLNGNIGVRGYVYGSDGARENRAVSAEAVTTASGRNVGVQSLVHSSQSENMAFQALMFNNGSGNSSQKNTGLKLELSNTSTQGNYGIEGFVDSDAPVNQGISLYVAGGQSNTGMTLSVDGSTGTNVGMVVNAPTAAELNGNLIVNGNIEHSGSITQTSDLNLKENIKNLEGGLSTIMQLRPTTYNFRGDGEYKGLSLSRGLHYGLIAQEVEEVLPSLVKTNKHTYLAPSEGNGPSNPEENTEVKSMDYKTMNYTELIPVLIKAVQEQQEEIEKLKAQLKALEKNKK